MSSRKIGAPTAAALRIHGPEIYQAQTGNGLYVFALPEPRESARR